MRIDLTDTTFIIPVRIDSMIRLENLLMSVDSIVRYFRTRILILEASSYQNEIIPSLIKDDTVKQLRTKTSDVAYPYDGNFLDTSDILREHYWVLSLLAYKPKILHQGS